jgi:hypothetical protein
MMLITADLNSTYYQMVASTLQHLHPLSVSSSGAEKRTTLIGDREIIF